MMKRMGKMYAGAPGMGEDMEDGPAPKVRTERDESMGDTDPMISGVGNGAGGDPMTKNTIGHGGDAECSISNTIGNKYG